MRPPCGLARVGAQLGYNTGRVILPVIVKILHIIKDYYTCDVVLMLFYDVIILMVSAH